jgi:hypothetical protein
MSKFTPKKSYRIGARFMSAARVFVHGKLFQSSLMLAGKASLPE